MDSSAVPGLVRWHWLRDASVERLFPSTARTHLAEPKGADFTMATQKLEDFRDTLW